MNNIKEGILINFNFTGIVENYLISRKLFNSRKKYYLISRSLQNLKIERRMKKIVRRKFFPRPFCDSSESMNQNGF